jgi:hypothetical protein
LHAKRRPLAAGRYVSPTTAASFVFGHAYGGITALLEDGDLLVGGAFTYKRVLVGDGN